MKQFSIVLNTVLLIAVAVLFYLHFSTSKPITAASKTNAPISKDSNCSHTFIAYVELDSLNNNVSFIKQKRKELEAEQKVIADEYENAYHQLEAEKNNFLKKGNAITQKEAEEFQTQLMQKQQQVEASKQEKAQKLADRGSRMMEDMQATLKNFLSEYNADKKYTYIMATGSRFDFLIYKDSTLNITDEIIKGLNDRMNKKAKQ